MHVKVKASKNPCTKTYSKVMFNWMSENISVIAVRIWAVMMHLKMEKIASYSETGFGETENLIFEPLNSLFLER